MTLKEFLFAAMSEGKTAQPSTKRLGHMAGILSGVGVVFLLTGVVVGLSIGIPPTQFQFAYTQLLNTITLLLGGLIGAGTTAYITTKKTEGNPP